MWHENIAQNTRPSLHVQEGLATRLGPSHVPTPGNEAIKSRTDAVSEPDSSQGLVPRLELTKRQCHWITKVVSYTAKLSLIPLHTHLKS